MCPRVGVCGKNRMSSALRRHVSWIDGARMVWILMVFRNASRPLSLEMRIRSIGHFAGLRSIVGSSAWFRTGTNRMYPLGMWMSVDIFGCP